KRSLERDRRTVAEMPKLFRKSWPKIEAISKRAARRKNKQVLRAVDAASAEDVVVAARPREKKKWPGTSITLRESIARKVRSRAARHGSRRRRKVSNRGHR